MRARRRTTAAAAIGVIAFALTAGCSGATTPETTPATPTVTSPAPVETVTPTEAPAPIAVVAGDVITAAQADALPEGQKGFEVADGSLVVVVASEPLPEPVREAIASEITESYVPGNGPASGGAAKQVAKKMSEETGKSILVISQNYGSINPNDEPSEVWVTKGQTSMIQATGDIDSQVANVQAWIAEQADPALWDYVVKN